MRGEGKKDIERSVGNKSVHSVRPRDTIPFIIIKKKIDMIFRISTRVSYLSPRDASPLSRVKLDG